MRRNIRRHDGVTVRRQIAAEEIPYGNGADILTANSVSLSGSESEMSVFLNIFKKCSLFTRIVLLFFHDF